MKMDYILSFDVGTSAVKAAVVGADGAIAGVADAAYPLLTPKPGWAEQEPDAYWRAVCLSARKALKASGVSAAQVRGVVFATQWKGIIPVDRNGAPLYNNILWLDTRAQEQADRLNAAMGRFIGVGSQYWPRLMWVKENLCDIYGCAYRILEVNSYLKFRATGEFTMDETNSFVSASDAGLQDYYNRILKAGGIDKGKFPSITAASEEAGRLTKQAAQELGLAIGTKVFGGCGDIPAIAIGSGCVGLHREHLYIGSSGWIGRVEEQPVLDGNFLFQVLCGGRFMVVSGMQSACMTQNWAVDLLYPQEKARLDAEFFPWLETEIAAVPPDSRNLLSTPWLYGETAPFSLDARSVFVNLSPEHTRSHMLCAVQEGVCFHLRLRRELMNAAEKPGTVRAVGGATASAHWMQCFADILNVTVEIPADAQHAGAAGAAACAAVGLGWWGTLGDADAHISAEKTYLPRREYTAHYDMLFGAFKMLYPALSDVFAKLNKEKQT